MRISKIGLLLILAGCISGKEPEPFFDLPLVPVNFGTHIPSPERNPLSPEGIELGRMLFYDPILSANNQVSCASCHLQELAFTDAQITSTAGVTQQPLLRHTPSLINLAWADGLFWEGGAKDLESLAFGPLNHPDEMAEDFKVLIPELHNRYDYRERFTRVFGKDTINAALIVRALAQFQRTLISGNSRYDRYIRGEEPSALSPAELKGLQLFTEKCSSCHTPGFFTDFSYHNNGLDSSFSADHEMIAMGRFRITGDSADIGKFKTPTLRNIGLTAPYMHDGRFGSLEEVLEHYDGGMRKSSTLDPEFIKAGRNSGIELSEPEKKLIIEFLGSLTDHEFTGNPAFSNPF